MCNLRVKKFSVLLSIILLMSGLFHFQTSAQTSGLTVTSAKLYFTEGNNKFAIKGKITPRVSDLTTVDLTIQVGTYSETITAGSFVKNGAKQTYQAASGTNGITKIILKNGKYFSVNAEEIDLSGTVTPVNISITIGDSYSECASINMTKTQKGKLWKLKGKSKKCSNSRNSPNAINEVTKKIYDALAADEDIKSYIIGVMAAFDVPTLGDSDLTTADSRLSKGLPLFTTTQAERIADAYNDNTVVTVDAFVDGLNEQGLTLKFPYSFYGQTITKDILSLIFSKYAYTSPDEAGVPYKSGERLPALVHSLGQERAKRFPPKTPDLIWGDDYLDPLQFTLLLYSIMSPEAGAAQSAASTPITAHAGAIDPIVDYVKDQIKDKVTSEVQDVVEVPLGEKEAAQVSVCASLLLYGHKVTVSNNPALLMHNPDTPNVTSVSMTLTFMDDYYNNYLAIDRWMLENVGNCTLPHQGPIAGKPIEWSVSSGIEDHGNYDLTPTQTDDNGEALASWRTISDSIPQSCKVFKNQRDAVGATTVRVGSLVPGWSTLESIVGFLKDTGNTGDSRLEVIYYDITDDPDCHPL
ncbi:MAG: hypothetical protein HZA77_12975 [Candidatus Schekmanbacteria bacterium]|nr:hypothetical protein [Candidatus Schekmanbacteria bacterium]